MRNLMLLGVGLISMASAIVADKFVFSRVVLQPSSVLSLGAGVLIAVGLASMQKTRRQRRSRLLVHRMLDRVTWADR
jgi:hypothetical protein